MLNSLENKTGGLQNMEEEAPKYKIILPQQHFLEPAGQRNKATKYRVLTYRQQVQQSTKLLELQ